MGGHTKNVVDETASNEALGDTDSIMMLPVSKAAVPMSPLAIERSNPPIFHDNLSGQDTYNFEEDLEGEEEEEEATQQQSHQDTNGKANPSATTNHGVVNRRTNVTGLVTSGDCANPLLLNGSTNVVTESLSDRVDGNVAFQNELRATINNFKSEWVRLDIVMRF